MKLQHTVFTGAAAFFILLGSATLVVAQAQDHEAHHPEGAGIERIQAQAQPGAGQMDQANSGMMPMRMDPEMMQQMHEMMMGRQAGRMMPGMMRQAASGMMLPMMRMMFALVDADGDGSLSRDEFVEAHERIFNHMDLDGDGQLTFEEVQAFMADPMRGVSPDGEPGGEADED
jgi:N-acetylglutamate synthase/N-acetylornithine aminotransferase